MPGVAKTVGRYEILREVGRGGMARVHLARQTDLDRFVALKELAAFHAADSSVARRFLGESRVAGSLSHPSIVTVHDYFEHDGTPFIAMEFVERGSLRPYVGHLTLAQVAGVLEGLLAGLAHAEQHGVVHRDLKPENLMVTADGRVKITDFGIAKATNRLQATAVATAAGTTVGTPAYMAPEQAMGQEIGPWTDLYSVGCIAFELLSGQVPFPAGDTPLAVLLRHVNETVPPLASVAPSIDPRISAWVERLLVKEAGRRVASAGDAWDELEEVVIALLGPRWRRDARLPPGPVPARPLTPAPFGADEEAEPSVPAAEPPPRDPSPTAPPPPDPSPAAEPPPSVRAAPPPPDPSPAAEPPSSVPAAPPPPDLSPAAERPSSVRAAPPPDPSPAAEPPPPSVPAAEAPPPDPSPTAAPPPPPVPAAEAPPPDPSPAAEPPPSVPAAPPPDFVADIVPAAEELPGTREPSLPPPPAEEVPPPASDDVATAHPAAVRADEAPARGEPADGLVPSAAPVPYRTPPADEAISRAPSVGAPRGRGPVTRRRRRRSLLPLALVAALAAGAAAGTLLGDAGDDAPPPASPVSATAGDLSIRLPSTYRPLASPPAVPGLALAGAAAYAPGGVDDGTAVVVGTARSQDPSLLPGAFRRTLPAVPEAGPVRLGDGGLEALRYAGLRPGGFDRAVTLYASPTSAGVATIACLSAADGAAAVCASVADSLALRSGEGLRVGPDPAYASRLSRVLADLGRSARTGRRGLRAATAARQAAAAAGIRRAYARAARRLVGGRLSPADRAANARVRARLRAASAAWGAAAAAARASSAAGFDRAEGRIRRAERALDRAVSSLEGAGYTLRG